MATDRGVHPARWTPLSAAALAVAAACGGEPGARAPSTLALAEDAAWRGPALAAFDLVERSGRRVSLEDLKGRPSVVAFIFTTCSGPCPRISARMRALQDRLADTSVRLVSFSVDPDTDTPQVLREYAARFGADAERWWFLTGAEGAIDAVVASVQLARAVDRDAPLGLQVSHSEKLVVLDADATVRGYYSSASDEDLESAAARARWLAAHAGR